MTDTEPTTPRVDPPYAADEVTMLRAFLGYYRATVRRQAEGLTHRQLLTRLEPSTMTLGGMLKHLAYAEYWWLPMVMEGRDHEGVWATGDWANDDDWDWHSADQDTTETLFDHFDAAIRESDRIIDHTVAERGLDAESARPTHRTGEPFTLRWILVHLIEEYARHAGHADLIRESIDGATDL
jgi:uncharacterized damage-inducible protein DinB